MSPIVDVHAHVLVPDAQLLVSRQPGFAEHQAAERRRLGAAARAIDAELLTARWLRPLVDLDTRLSTMDAAGVDVQAVSVVPWQYHYWADRPLAGELVDVLNGEVAALARQAPDRLVGVATVALQHPELAADQLRQAVDNYDFRGVQISTSARGRDLAHPAFDRLWSIAESLGVVVFVHPWSGRFGDRPATAYPADAIEQPTEITLALSHLVLCGVLDRFPGLAVCGAYGGGNITQYLRHADHAYDLRPQCRTTNHHPTDYLRRLYVDSLIHHGDTLRRVVDVAGPDRVLLGTEYPFEQADA